MDSNHHSPPHGRPARTRLHSSDSLVDCSACLSASGVTRSVDLALPLLLRELLESRPPCDPCFAGHLRTWKRFTRRLHLPEATSAVRFKYAPSTLSRKDLFLVRQPDQLLGVLERLGRHTLAREHAADLVLPVLLRQFLNPGHRASLRLVLLDQIVMVRESGYLREVRDAQHLVRCREPL